METDEPETATVGAALFTDLVGFTEYTAAVGDAAALEVLDHQTDLARAVLAAHGDGRIVKELGDGLMIWFDTAEVGLAGAVALLEEVERGRVEGSFPLAMRLGLHHGEATRRGEDLVGHTINVAARVSALAGPGELLVSDQVVAACGDGAPLDLRFHAIGPVEVKGVQDPVWLRRLGRS